MTVPVLNFRDFIAADGEQLLTTSQQVSAVFGKRHDHVLDKVRALMRDLPEEFNAPNFRVVSYLDAKGESRVSFQMTRDGFTLLAMSFSGKKALAFKVAYINAFNAMEAYIKNQREGLQFDYLRKELEYKTRKGKISACAREMRHWRDEKPDRLGEMNSLLEQMQPSLISH